MEAFALYLIKSVVWLAGFALIFILFLRNERFFVLNRIYLIAGILISFFFPLISIHYTVVLPVVRNLQFDNTVADQIQNAGNNIIPDLKLTLSVIYILGVLFVLTLIIRQGRSLLRAIKKSEIIVLRPAKLIKTPDYTSSFSFFSYVFVNPSVTDIETKEIMIHEMVHIRQKHWFDLLLVELLCMMQWFNPLVWIYVRFIRQNHEYLADEVALQQTSDPAIYRAVLLNQIVGAPVVSLANSFNYSLSKKRFNMMKNIISSPYRKMKILLILPVFAIVLYAFAKPDYKYKYVDESSGSNITGFSSLQKTVKGTVVQQNGTPLQGAAIVVKGTYLGVTSDSKGNFKLDNVPDDGLLVVSFVGFKSKVLKPVFTSEMIINMVRDTIRYLNENISTPPPQPPPPPLDTVVNLRNIEIPLPPPPPPPPPLDTVTYTVAAYNEKNWEIYNTLDSLGKLLVIIDGVIHEKDGMSNLSQDDIATMNVLKYDAAEKKYGEKGKNGAIEVTTFKNKDEKPDVKVVAKYPDDPKTGKEPVEVVQAVPKPSKDAVVVVEEMPEFPGGKDAMIAWIVANVKYPAEAVKGKITGKVYVNFIISNTGKVRNVSVVKSVNPLLNEEAKRVVSSMPDWKPGSQAGKPVDVQMLVPVEFKLK